MGPEVLHSGSARAAAAAALLRSRFKVREWSATTLVTAPSVFLIDGDATEDLALCASADWAPLLRIIGLVNPDAAGPWPSSWYAVLPAGVSDAILAATVTNAGADVAAADELARLGSELAHLNTIGIRLSAERDPDALLGLILRIAREITQSDAGSLYLVEPSSEGRRQLRFALVQNDSIAVPFRSVTIPLTSESVAGHVALSGEVVNLPDAYEPSPGASFQINRSFDETVGYRTKSMLVVPLRTPTGDSIGALQLINCKREFAARLTSDRDVEHHVVSFTARHERLARSLASQAAVALDNSRLYQSVHRLFEGFVRAAVTAIESRDPTTSGHSFRVAELSVALAEVVTRCPSGPYRQTRFTADELMELRYASLLHDFGKVGVREQVLVKAKKLYPAELDRIRHRIALIKRGVELRAMARKLDVLLQEDRLRYAEHAAAVDGELAGLLVELDASLERVVTANEPTILPGDCAEHLAALTEQRFEDHLGQRHAVLTAEEARALSIAKGSLTPEEMREIQSHVVHTFQFLTQIPWTCEFRRVPEIARSHHEKLDGSGYPQGLTAEEIPVQSKIMAIADIYDALTAGDRPYKKAISVERALAIMEGERQAGLIDGDLLGLFVAEKVYERTRAGAGGAD